MARFRCTVCGFVYDEDEEGTPFADLPDELDAAMSKAFASKKPALIDVVVDPERMAASASKVD